MKYVGVSLGLAPSILPGANGRILPCVIEGRSGGIRSSILDILLRD